MAAALDPGFFALLTQSYARALQHLDATLGA